MHGLLMWTTISLEQLIMDSGHCSKGGDMATSNQGKQKQTSPSFKATPNSKMLAVVSIAILAGLLLVWVVNDKDSSKSTSSKKSESASTDKSSDESNTGNETNTSSTSSTTTTTVVANTKKPAQVSVLVLNGSGFGGVAKNTSTEIGKLGYNMLTPGDDSSKDVGTFVYYKTGFEPDATRIAKNVLPGILTVLQIPQKVTVAQFPSSAPAAWTQTQLIPANVIVIIGNKV